ncbi:hypothetical protein MHB50_01945 [Siminovitchia sp. FSL H7-0308]|uniref:Uncharacterized protein n=1 Tax=Siminovitchia thermophila TaxID=1245522 RepID=A0ABS2R4M4_9BACI|nr:hypothetical protein [Siminovitchia thermophila]MBM7714124.1 hypothetical protein [Siminovitchia thermophila]
MFNFRGVCRQSEDPFGSFFHLNGRLKSDGITKKLYLSEELLIESIVVQGIPVPAARSQKGSESFFRGYGIEDGHGRLTFMLEVIFISSALFEKMSYDSSTSVVFPIWPAFPLFIFITTPPVVILEH